MTDAIWVTAVRVLSALAALVVPLPAMWLSGHIDRWDWSLLGMPAASEHQQHVYQYWDKSVDTFTLAVVLVVALGWKDQFARRLAIAAFAWRFAGVVAFMATGEHVMFVAFPSVLEKLFFFYLVFRVLSRQEIMFGSRADAVVTMIALTVPKIADEYFIHIGGRPWQTLTLLPAGLSTPDREYWAWVMILLALPTLAMARLVLQKPETKGAEIPLLTALLGRQVSPAPASGPSVPAATRDGRPYQLVANTLIGKVRALLRLPRLSKEQPVAAIMEGAFPATSEPPLIETRRPIASLLD